MGAFAQLHLEFNVLGHSIAHHAKGLARFDCAENANQPFSHFVLSGNFSGHVFFAGLTGVNKHQRPLELFRQLLGLLLYRLGRPLDQLSKIFDQNVTSAQIGFHDSRAIQLAQCPSQTKPIKSGKNSGDRGTVFLYKRVGNAVVDCGWSFHSTSLTTRPSRFLLFGCGSAALCLCGSNNSCR